MHTFFKITSSISRKAYEIELKLFESIERRGKGKGGVEQGKFEFFVDRAGRG